MYILHIFAKGYHVYNTRSEATWHVAQMGEVGQYHTQPAPEGSTTVDRAFNRSGELVAIVVKAIDHTKE